MDGLSKFNRRLFLKYGLTTVASVALSNFPTSLMANSRKAIKISILHTNDWHSRIEAFPKNDRSYPGLGGAESRAALIKKIRSEEEHVLLLDAGDIFQGTPYFNFYKGELEYKLMSKMGYDCVTLGNHDFDNGIEGILKQLSHATFELINCNYDVSNTPLSEVVKPFKIIIKEGVKIGILGVGIELKGLVPDHLIGEINYLDPINTANKIARLLKKEYKCDLVICLSHLGYQYTNDKASDRILAANSENIDLILGGHTHTFLEKPVVVQNSIGQTVLINQVGWGGIYLGRIDFYFERGNKRSFNYQSFLHNL